MKLSEIKHVSDQQQIDDQIIAAQKAQLEKPNSTGVNSESAFVHQRLKDAGHSEAAKKYWSWITMPFGANKIVNPEIIRLQKELNSVDKESKIPDWGRSGT